MYRKVEQLDFLTLILAAFFPNLCTRIRLPNDSIRERPIYAMRLASGGGNNRRGILIVGGTHSQELMNPDAIVELLFAMVLSYVQGGDIVLGNRRWPAAEIKAMIDVLDIWAVPCANPDGRDFVMTEDDLWRKNRRDYPWPNRRARSVLAGAECDGVDLNRNYDILWGVIQDESYTSCAACTSVYVGSEAFSEPETRNIKYLLDTQRIDTFVDVHSFKELVLYPWSHAPTQTSTDSMQRFTDLPTATCEPIGLPGYEEYMAPRDELRFRTVAGRIVEAIADVRGRRYTPQPGKDLYATTGTSKDYVYSRHIANSALRRTYGFTFETGPDTGNTKESYHPQDPTLIKQDAKSGILALIQQTICAIEFIGVTFLGRQRESDALSTVRDELLMTTEAGRDWISLFERVQGRLLAAVLADEALVREATMLLEHAGALVEDEGAVLDEEGANRGLAFLDALIARTPPDLHDDLKRLRRPLEQAAGSHARAIVERFTRAGPAATAKG
jgi:murein tripeptide amidase MpaA